MEIALKESRSILTPQKAGVLASGPYPFTHALSDYIGCGFGQTTCGMYCYAQFLPSWTFSGFTAPWGQAVQVKENAPQLLEQTLRRMRPAERRKLRIFMSSATDPYQPLESKYQVTRRCLEVFARYPDLDLLQIQTRSPLAERDFGLMAQIPYLWLSITIETDDQGYLKSLKGGPLLEKRWLLVKAARQANLQTQITVSPCLPYTSIGAFGQRLIASGAQRLIVDTIVDGDGSGGGRTARSPFGNVADWRETEPAHELYKYLKKETADTAIEVAWSVPGFCGIQPRTIQGELFAG